MPRDTRAVWAKRVERWADSGLTAKEYAAEAGVNANTLTHWKWRLGRSEGEAPQQVQPPNFLEVVRVSEDRAPGGRQPREVAAERFEVILRSGHRVLVPAHFDVQGLRQLVNALEAR